MSLLLPATERTAVATAMFITGARERSRLQSQRCGTLNLDLAMVGDTTVDKAFDIDACQRLLKKAGLR